MTRVVAMPFRFFLDLDRVLAIHRPWFKVEHHRSGCGARLGFRIDGGTHVGFVEYLRYPEEDEVRHPRRSSGITDWHELDVLCLPGEWVRWSGEENGMPAPVCLARLQQQVDALVNQWRTP